MQHTTHANRISFIRLLLCIFIVGVGLVLMELDMGYGYLKRTQLQNALESAALSAAVTIKQSGLSGKDQAKIDAASIFKANAQFSDNQWMLGLEDDLVFLFSEATIESRGEFVPIYAQISISLFSLQPQLIQVAGFHGLSIQATKVVSLQGDYPVIVDYD